MEAYLLYTVAALQWGYASACWFKGDVYKGVLMFLYGVTNIVFVILWESK